MAACGIVYRIGYRVLDDRIPFKHSVHILFYSEIKISASLAMLFFFLSLFCCFPSEIKKEKKRSWLFAASVNFMPGKRSTADKRDTKFLRFSLFFGWAYVLWLLTTEVLVHEAWGYGAQKGLTSWYLAEKHCIASKTMNVFIRGIFLV